MTRHSTAFEAERPVPAVDAVKDLLPDNVAKSSPSEAAPAPAAIKKLNFRKMLMAGAAVAVLTGAAWYGWNYWAVGPYLVSTDDAYVKREHPTRRPQVSGQ